MTVLLSALLALLLTVPLLRFWVAGYDGPLWWSWHPIALFPFRTPVEFQIRSPLGGWMIACLTVSGWAIWQTWQAGTIGEVAFWLALKELGYAIYTQWLGRPEAPEPVEFPVISFGLWHNALLEEVWFRAFPYALITLLGWRHGGVTLLYLLLTSVLFGLYHLWNMHPLRMLDTTLFGVLLAWVTLRYGVAAAVLIHLCHNSLAIPLYRPSQRKAWHRTTQLWWGGLTLSGATWIIWESLR